MNNITIELCAEDRARLDRIADLLEAQNAGTVKSVSSKPEKTATEPKKVEAPTSAQPKAEKPTVAKQPAHNDAVDALAYAVASAPETTEEEAPAVELTDLQQIIIKLANAGKQAELRKVIFEYAERVTQIPEDKYAEVYAKLQELEG